MKYDAIIVGAGFGGMYMLHRLRQLGFSARVLEAGKGVGGTWYWNRYPGARCDVQSIDYSYSFDDALQQEWQWSEKYATQPEILRYANHVAERFDLLRDIQFGTRVASASYQDKSAEWQIETAAGEEIHAHFYIMASGCLSVAKDIDIVGRETFAGRNYHTADWPHDGVDFSGQRVAVIGTGSSAIQSIPLIAAQAANLTVFQRTPAFSLPAFNRPVDSAAISALKARYNEHRETARHSSFGVPDYPMEKSALEATPAEREVAFECGWQAGSLIGILQSYNDLLVNAEANDTACEFIRNKIRSIVKDPATAATLCPTDFPVGTKRACLDTGYYECFNRETVDLVDLRETPLLEVTTQGLRTSAENFEFDAIVYATGFDAMTGALVNVDIRGKDGLELKAKWAAGPHTYLGIAMAGFPNLFTITGPGSPSVMSNMMVSIEQHVDWIADCMAYLREHACASIEATLDAENNWVQHVNEVANMTLFPQANSWYMGANVPGKARVFMPYIGGVGAYRKQCDADAAAGYAGFDIAPTTERDVLAPASAG
jgi:cation diffusion facilitator CzcD-associated flavoprotein CzcO